MRDRARRSGTTRRSSDRAWGVAALATALLACACRPDARPLTAPPPPKPVGAAPSLTPTPSIATADVIAHVVVRRALFTDADPSPDAALAALRATIEEFARPAGIRSDSNCYIEREIQYRCRLLGLADAGLAETHEGLVQSASDLGWVPAGEPREQASRDSVSWNGTLRRGALGLTISTTRTRGLLGSSYEVVVTKLEGVGSMPRVEESPEDVRVAWRQITSHIEGYHFESCGFLDETYRCRSVVPLTTTQHAILNHVADELIEDGWLPTTELPVVFERGLGGFYRWSFLRGGLLVGLNVDIAGQGNIPPFIRVAVERLSV